MRDFDTYSTSYARFLVPYAQTTAVCAYGSHSNENDFPCVRMPEFHFLMTKESSIERGSFE